jgi:NADH:ubiquinone oxidoreductase subunit 4 (subunit M)
MTTNVEPECNIPILYLACCVEVIGQGLASIPQTNFLKFIAYCRILFLGLHGLLNLKQKWS